ncbi:MAG: family 43 glycosylhydrolase [Prevotella sp.]
MMKKNRETLLAASLLLATTLTAQTNIQNAFTSTDWGAANSSGVAVDLDNDGHCDLVFGGVGKHVTNMAGGQSWEQTRMTHVALFSPQDGSWNLVGHTSLQRFDTGIAMNVADRPSFSACDMNQDGIMDIVAFETTGRAYTEWPYLDHVSREGIFLGNGDGTFEQFHPTFVDNAGNVTDFDLHTILSADVADFNGDGLMDIVGIGYQTNAQSATTYADANVVLLNQGGGVFKVTHFFTDPYVKDDYGQDGKTYHFECGQVKVYDFNADGYPDFFINSNSNDRDALGVTNGVSTHFSDLFLNDPAKPGQFRRCHIDKAATGNSVPPMSEGGIAVADFDNDGLPEMFYSGWTGNGRSTYVYRIYDMEVTEDGGVAFYNKGNCGLSDLRNQNSTSTQYGAMDWDGDGNYDLFNIGWLPRLSTQTGMICTGNGALSFTEAYRVGAGSEGCVLFLDWDGDGNNDYLTLSQSGDATFYSTSAFQKYFSTTRNPNNIATRPQPPVLQAAQVEGDKVVLSWTAAGEQDANATFEYYVKNAEGRVVAGGNAFVGGDNDGVRKVVQPGNAFNARSVTLYLPDGTYTYGVQTVNASYAGSTFATATFTVTGSDRTVPEEMVKPEKTVIGETYANPIIDRSVPDPTVLRDASGYYYLYGTEDIRNMPIYRSKNLTSWTYMGTVFNETTRPTMVPDGGLWAPDINYIDGQYVIYFAKSTWGGEWDCGIGVATALRPYGPFKNATKLFLSNEIGVQNSIDPFYIEEDGHKYLFWGSFRGIYGIELADDGLSVKEGAEKVQVAGTAIEAVYIIKHDGYFYLMGSAGSCCEGANSTYHVIMARSKNLFGPYVDKTGGKALDNQLSNLLYGNGDIAGPGHNAEFVTDDAGQYWMIYHGYERAKADEGRKVFMDRVMWDKDGWPYIENATSSTEAAIPVIGTSGIDELEATSPDGEQLGMSILPRVAKTQFTIALKDGGTFKWRIVTPHGKTVKKGTANGSVTVATNDMHLGLYIVDITAKNGHCSEKVVVAGN